jgi:hypothetical protein
MQYEFCVALHRKRLQIYRTKLSRRKLMIRIHKYNYISSVLFWWAWKLFCGAERCCLRTKCWTEYLGSNKENVTRAWRKLYNEQSHNLQTYSSPNVIRMIKSRNMRWPGCGDEKCIQIWILNTNEGIAWETGVIERVSLKLPGRKERER